MKKQKSNYAEKLREEIKEEIFKDIIRKAKVTDIEIAKFRELFFEDDEIEKAISLTQDKILTQVLKEIDMLTINEMLTDFLVDGEESNELTEFARKWTEYLQNYLMDRIFTKLSETKNTKLKRS